MSEWGGPVRQEGHLGSHDGRKSPEVSFGAPDGFSSELCAPALGVELSGETAALPGKRRHSITDCYPVELDGERIGIIAMVRDVTAEREATVVLSRNEERERLVQALRESERRFARLAESGIIGIAIRRLDGEVVEANDAYLTMLGYTPDDLSAGVIRWSDDPNSTEADGGALEQLMGRGVAAAFEKPKRRKDGTIMPDSRSPRGVAAEAPPYAKCRDKRSASPARVRTGLPAVLTGMTAMDPPRCGLRAGVASVA